MQDYELQAWLGDTELTADQLDELRTAARDLEDAYPGKDNADDREIALSTALQVILGEADTLETLGTRRTKAALAAHEAKVELFERIRWEIRAGETETGIARRAGVDRMTVRKIAGKR